MVHRGGQEGVVRGPGQAEGSKDRGSVFSGYPEKCAMLADVGRICSQ